MFPRCFQGVSKVFPRCFQGVSTSTSLSRSRVLAARSCPACRPATTSSSQSPPPSPSTPRSPSSPRSTCILSLNPSLPLSPSLSLSLSIPPSLSLSLPALRLHPLSPSLSQVTDFCLLLVKFLQQCDIPAQNAAISAKYPRICPAVKAMKPKYEALFERWGIHLIDT